MVLNQLKLLEHYLMKNTSIEFKAKVIKKAKAVATSDEA